MPIRDWLLSFWPERQTIAWREKTRISIATGLSILLTGLISSHFLAGAGVPLIAISMGASAVLLFGVPGGLLSQPWPLLGGHLVSGLIGIAFAARNKRFCTHAAGNNAQLTCACTYGSFACD